MADLGYSPLSISLAPSSKLWVWRTLNRIDWIGTSVAAPAAANQGYVNTGALTILDHYAYSFRSHVRETFSTNQCLA